jgi:hypothetical protein
MRFMKRGQAATEFIMTYGWAILVVLAAVGALAYFGVLSPDKFLPETCSFPAGLSCIDKAVVTATTGDMQLALKNNVGYKIELVSVSGTDDCSGANLSSPASGTMVDNNGQATLTIDCGATLPTGRFSSDITVVYINNETGLTHRTTGSIRGRAS